MPGERIEVKVDLVVLAAGMVPNSADGEAIRALEDAKVKASTEGDSETQRAKAAETVEELKHHEGTEILNLEYRQGPDLPILRVRFPGFAFHLLPLRDPAHRDLPGRVRAPADGRLGSREDARRARR